MRRVSFWYPYCEMEVASRNKHLEGSASSNDRPSSVAVLLRLHLKTGAKGPAWLEYLVYCRLSNDSTGQTACLSALEGGMKWFIKALIDTSGLQSRVEPYSAT